MSVFSILELKQDALVFTLRLERFFCKIWKQTIAFIIVK